MEGIAIALFGILGILCFASGAVIALAEEKAEKKRKAREHMENLILAKLMDIHEELECKKEN